MFCSDFSLVDFTDILQCYLALGQSYDWSDVCETTQNDMGQFVKWTQYDW